VNEYSIYLISRHKIKIALIISCIIHVIFFSFIYYYPLKYLYFSSEGEGGSIQHPYDAVTTFDTSSETPQSFEKTDKNIEIPRGDDQEQPETDTSEPLEEDLPDENTSEAAITKDQNSEIQQENAESYENKEDTSLPESSSQDTTEYQDKTKTDESAMLPPDIPEQKNIDTPVPDEMSVPTNTQTITKPLSDDTPSDTKPRRKIKRVIRRIKKKKRTGTYRPHHAIFSKANLDKARKKVFKGQYGSSKGNSNRYAYITQQLNAQKMMCYNARVGETLQSEFARYRTPIVFPESLEHHLKGEIVINKDGTVKDYICKEPTGIKEFDEFVTFVIKQSRFAPLPRHYNQPTCTQEFSPMVHARKGTNVFRLTLPPKKVYDD
jgi:hypothetical protein